MSKHDDGDGDGDGGGDGGGDGNGGGDGGVGDEDDDDDDDDDDDAAADDDDNDDDGTLTTSLTHFSSKGWENVDSLALTFSACWALCSSQRASWAWRLNRRSRPTKLLPYEKLQRQREAVNQHWMLP